MKKLKCLLSTMAIACIVFSACSKSNEMSQVNDNTGGTNNNSCDTANMKYTTDVKPILQANCYSCHGNGLSQNGVSLDTYSAVKTQADNGNLVGVITHAAGYPPMPQGGAKLPDCSINKIKDWINRGALNN